MDPTVLVTVASGDEHLLLDIDWTIAIQFGLFVLMFLIGNALIFQPYLRLRERRRAGIEGAREEATSMGAEADARLVDYEKQLAAARSRAGDEQRKVRAEAAAYERETTEKARATAAKALDEAQAKVKAETEAARAQIMPQADALARQMASRLLGREVA